MQSKQPDIRIEKWKCSRFWAIFVDGELLAVTVYKKGAEALRRLVLGERCNRTSDPDGSSQEAVPAQTIR